MSRQQDLMFCKIAVANGMITEDQAKKCLALANKRELEGGRRPQVGAIFSKYNILHRQQVQMVYEAINKRMGGNASPAGGIPAQQKSRAGRRERQGYAGREDGSKNRRVDPQTLWLGIAFGVVFLGIIVGIFVMFAMGRDDKKVEEDSALAEKTVESGDAGKSDPAAKGPAATGRSGGKPLDGGIRSMDPQHKSSIMQALRDARTQSLADEARAIELMDDLKSKIQSRGVYVDVATQTEIDSTYDDLKSRVSGAPSGDAGDAGGAGEVGDDLGAPDDF